MIDIFSARHFPHWNELISRYLASFVSAQHAQQLHTHTRQITRCWSLDFVIIRITPLYLLRFFFYFTHHHRHNYRIQWLNGFFVPFLLLFYAYFCTFIRLFRTETHTKPKLGGKEAKEMYTYYVDSSSPYKSIKGFIKYFFFWRLVFSHRFAVVDVESELIHYAGHFSSHCLQENTFDFHFSSLFFSCAFGAQKVILHRRRYALLYRVYNFADVWFRSVIW